MGQKWAFLGQKWPFFAVFKVKIEFLVKWPLILLKTFKVYKNKEKVLAKLVAK